MDHDLRLRVERLEAHAAIQQLAIRYAQAIDERNLDAWTSLFVEDVDCGRTGVGRDALRRSVEKSLRTFYRSIHYVCGHRIEMESASRAMGQVYCRAEHEDGSNWIVMAICYFDEYERRNGDWFFKRRRERHWYAADLMQRPAPPFHNWPGHHAKAQLPGALSNWNDFWSASTEDEISRLTALPVWPDA